MRYMIFSGPEAFPARSLTRSRSHLPNAAASSVYPSPRRAYTENDASRTHVNR